MHPPAVYWNHLKRSFEEVIFSSNIVKTHESSRDKAKKGKAPIVSSNKREVNVLREEKHFNFKNSFWCDSISSPSIIPFQNPFPKSLR
jgi:hypothetical protein